MTVATHILQRPAQFQWDSDSTPKADNCRPTSEAMIAGYYRDTHISPTSMRTRMTGKVGTTGGTNAPQGVRGLNSYNVPSAWGWISASALKTKVAAGIPVDIAVNYGKIPKNKAYRTDFNFNGTHSVVACSVGKYEDHNGVVRNGIWVRDPDHGSPARPERPSKTFWPDWVWVNAFHDLSTSKTLGCATYPKYKKVLPPPDPSPHVAKYVVTASALNVRTGPSASYAKVTTVSKGYKFTSTMLKRHGGSYKVGTTTHTDWVGFARLGKTVWVARGYCKLY